jgi:hypothetical protein
MVICGGPVCGLTLGAILGDLYGGLAGRWLGMGIGGALMGGLAWFASLTNRPRIGDRGSSLRIAAFLLLVGVYGSCWASWAGEIGLLLGWPCSAPDTGRCMG